MTERVAQSNENQKARILLVHGTWGGTPSDPSFPPTWFTEGTPFVDGLTQLLRKDGIEPSYEVFLWNGFNLETDRESAAIRLYDKLEQYHCDPHALPYHVIAHSHGGGVLWRALQLASMNRVGLKHLSSCTTIGTPFFVFETNPVHREYWLPLLLLPAIGALLAILGLGLVLALDWSLANAYFFDVPEKNGQTNILTEYQAAVEMFGISSVGAAAIASSVAGAICLVRLSVAGWAWRSVSARRNADAELVKKEDLNWLSLYSSQDEAINGLRHTLSMRFEVVSPVFEDKRYASTRILDAVIRLGIRVLAPARANVICPLINDAFTLLAVRRLQGIDVPTLAIRSVLEVPSLGLATRGHLLSSEHDAEIVPRSTEAAVETVRSVMAALRGLLVRGRLDVVADLSNALGPKFTGKELVHCTYFDSSEVLKLVAENIRGTAKPAGIDGQAVTGIGNTLLTPMRRALYISAICIGVVWAVGMLLTAIMATLYWASFFLPDTNAGNIPPG